MAMRWRHEAARAFEVGSRLAAQADRLGVPHGIAPAMPQSILELSMMEGQIHSVAKALCAHTGLAASSLEQLIDQLEYFGTGQQRGGGYWR